MANEIGKTYIRPWGNYQTLALAENYQIKIITVNPSGKLSLQKHTKRTEHWIVIAGAPTITIDSTSKVYNINQHCFIPQNTPHRLENTTNELVMVIEIQYGTYLKEDDIIRLDDIYGRI